MDSLQEGRTCSLCGAKETNKSTCPLNKNSKNQNPDKHNIRKGMKREVNNKLKTLYYNIKVYLRNEHKDYPINYSKTVAKKIIDWYNKRITGTSGYFTSYIKDFKIKHIKNNLFQVSYKQIGEIYLTEIIDPDDDGNNPIKLNTNEYIVVGRY
jgi:hypothetical protein